MKKEDRAKDGPDERRRRRRREKNALRAERLRELALASPVLTAEEAAAYCHLSYSYVSKQLMRYRRSQEGKGAYTPPPEGVDIMQARPEKLGTSWFFLRSELDRVLGVR